MSDDKPRLIMTGNIDLDSGAFENGFIRLDIYDKVKAELETLKAENERLKKTNINLKAHEWKILTEQNRIMKEALEFYADAKTWENAERFRRCVGTDGSNTAREALARCKELEK